MTITSNGEIYNFVNVIKTVSSVGVDNISNANFTASQLEDVLTSIDQSNVLSKVLTNVINTTLKMLMILLLALRQLNYKI